jgi:thiol-disulfide isomerase/thioredoxin
MTKTLALLLVSLSFVLACDEPPPPAAGALRGVGVAARPADDARTLEGFCDVHHASGAGPSFTPPPGATPTTGSGPRWLNVWATWCAPCVEELPRMARFRETLVGEGTNVEVTYVSADANDAAIEAFRRRHPSTPEGGRVPELAQLQAWLPSVGLDTGAPLPVHVFVGADGKVRCARAGGIDDDDLDAVRAALR